jgi:hypothetical protein
LLDGRAGDSRTGPTWTPPLIAAFWIAALASATTDVRESFAGSMRKLSISFFKTNTLSS